MKPIHSMIAALGLAFGLSAPADAGINDPEVIIYRFPGVRDDGGGTNVGVATVFHCTNFSGTDENIRFATRREDGTLVGNQVFFTRHLLTISAGTHNALPYAGVPIGLTFGASTGALNPGTTAIAATSINVICTAMTVDAANPKPDGVALRGIRFNPAPGSQE